MNDPPKKIAWQRIVVGGLAGTVAATFVNQTLKRIVLATVDVDAAFGPFDGETVIAFTLLGSLAASGVLLLVNKFAHDPWKLFQRVAFGALLLSFVPDFGLLISKAPGATWLTVGLLMTMHVLAYALVMLGFRTAIHWKNPGNAAPSQTAQDRPQQRTGHENH